MPGSALGCQGSGQPGSDPWWATHEELPIASEWESLLRYEIEKVAALPHVVAYVEGGYSDANSVG
jgi:hypothetical protein